MKLHHKIARLFGYELIKRKKHSTLNSDLMYLIERHAIELVLDVGANSGQFGAMLRKEGYKGEIHSFEPVSETFELLRATCSGDHSWFVHQVAMGDVCGKTSIHVTKGSTLSSFLKPNDYGKESFKGIKVISEEMVEISTIENFLTTQVTDYDKRRILLKMDTQGYDLKVFRGALPVMESIVCVLSEISVTPIYANMPHYLDVLKEYEEYGFVVIDFYPVSRKENLSLIELDCTLLNSKYA